jgi:hypothetical protein
MPLYRITFTEHDGYTVPCRIRTRVDQPILIALAVEKVWGPGCYWVPEPGSATEGRVYFSPDDEPSPDDLPRTGRTTVEVTLVRRRASEPHARRHDA